MDLVRAFWFATRIFVWFIIKIKQFLHSSLKLIKVRYCIELLCGAMIAYYPKDSEYSPKTIVFVFFCLHRYIEANFLLLRDLFDANCKCRNALTVILNICLSYILFTMEPNKLVTVVPLMAVLIIHCYIFGLPKLPLNDLSIAHLRTFLCKYKRNLIGCVTAMLLYILITLFTRESLYNYIAESITIAYLC